MDLEDILVSNLILPIGSLIYTLFCTSKYGWGWDNYLKEVNTGNGLKVPGKIRFYCKWILPLVTLFIIVKAIKMKKQLPIILPPGIFIKMFGNVIKIRLGP